MDDKINHIFEQESKRRLPKLSHTLLVFQTRLTPDLCQGLTKEGTSCGSARISQQDHSRIPFAPS